jgi:hypothetical protein
MRCQITIKGAPCNAKARTDTLYRARTGCVELQRHRKRLGIDGFAPSPFPAPPSRTGQSCQGPLPHEITFEFGKRPRDLEKELARDGGRINRLHHTLEADLLLV